MELLGDAGVSESLGATNWLSGTGENDVDDLAKHFIVNGGCIKVCRVQVLAELGVIDSVGNPG